MRKDLTPEVHYYDWSLTRWFTSDTHDILDATGRGIYRELLDRCYGQGRIPSDPAILARMCRATEAQFAEVWPLIKQHFPTDKNNALYLRNLHSDVYRANYFRYKKTQAKNGKKGGRPKVEMPRADNTNEMSGKETNGLASAKAVSKAKKSLILNSTLLNSTSLNPTQERGEGAVAPSPPTGFAAIASTGNADLFEWASEVYSRVGPVESDAWKAFERYVTGYDDAKALRENLEGWIAHKSESNGWRGFKNLLKSGIWKNPAPQKKSVWDEVEERFAKEAGGERKQHAH